MIAEVMVLSKMTESSRTPNAKRSATGALVQAVLADISASGPVQLEPDERLWKVYIFRPASGRATHLEHRIYSKLKLRRPPRARHIRRSSTERRGRRSARGLRVYPHCRAMTWDTLSIRSAARPTKTRTSITRWI